MRHLQNQDGRVGSLFCPHFGKLKIWWAEEIARSTWLIRVKKLI
jgi:hypothetical protein